MGDAGRARRAFQNAVRTNEALGSPRGTGFSLLGLVAVDVGVVIEHPMDPGLAERIAALEASIRP